LFFWFLDSSFQCGLFVVPVLHLLYSRVWFF
jgi:hypothetical protein